MTPCQNGRFAENHYQTSIKTNSVTQPRQLTMTIDHPSVVPTSICGMLRVDECCFLIDWVLKSSQFQLFGTRSRCSGQLSVGSNVINQIYMKNNKKLHNIRRCEEIRSYFVFQVVYNNKFTKNELIYVLTVTCRQLTCFPNVNCRLTSQIR